MLGESTKVRFHANWIRLKNMIKTHVENTNSNKTQLDKAAKTNFFLLVEAKNVFLTIITESHNRQTAKDPTFFSLNIYHLDKNKYTL